MGHEQASFTLNRYTHAPEDYEDRVRLAFEASADFPLTFDLQGRTDATAGDQDSDFCPAGTLPARSVGK